MKIYSPVTSELLTDRKADGKLSLTAELEVAGEKEVDAAVAAARAAFEGPWSQYTVVRNCLPHELILATTSSTSSQNSRPH